MSKNKNNNPQQHLSMLARSLLETFQGDKNRTTRIIQRLSRCRNKKTIIHILSYQGVYPGESENISNQAIKELAEYFTENQDKLFAIDIDIEIAVASESQIFSERNSDDLDHELQPTIIS